MIETHFERIANTFARSHGITVRFGPGQVAVNLKTREITLPDLVNGLDGPDVQVVEGALDHEVAHVIAELQAEARGLPLPSAVVDSIGDETTRLWFNAIEDVRAEAIVRARWIGVADNLDVNRAAAVAAMTPDRAKLCSGHWRLAIAGICIGTGMDLPPWLTEADLALVDTIRPMFATAGELSHAGEALAVARQIVASLPAQPAWVPAVSVVMPQPPKLVNRLPIKKSQLTVKVDQTDPLQLAIDLSMEGLLRVDVKTSKVPIAHPDTKARDRVVTAARDPAPYARSLAPAVRWTHVATSKLAAMMRCNVDRLTVDQNAGDLDPTALAGVATGDLRIFEGMAKRIDRDAAVIVLVDQSSSMRRYDGLSRTGVVAIAWALHRCGVAFEILGFHHGGSPGTHQQYRYTRVEPQTIIEYKTFGEHFPAVATRLGSLIGQDRNNDDPTAILSVAPRLTARREKIKILLTVSDGRPFHRGRYNPSQMEYAVGQCRKAGIQVGGLGIGYETVRDLYGEDSEVATTHVQVVTGLVTLFDRMWRKSYGIA